MERDNTPPGRHLRCSNIVKIVIHKKFLIIGIFQHIEKITPKSLLFHSSAFPLTEVSASEAYLSNILTNLCIALYCILLYCIVLGCVVLLIYCYVDIIQCNAMHKFVGVLDNPPLKCPLSLRNSSRRKRLRRPPFWKCLGSYVMFMWRHSVRLEIGRNIVNGRKEKNLETDVASFTRLAKSIFSNRLSTSLYLQCYHFGVWSMFGS